MALETASYVANLVESNPDGLDQRSTADNHLRLIKAALKRTFPKMDGPVSLSSVQVMYLNDVSASVQSQLNQLRDGSATVVHALYANSASYAAVAGNAVAVGGYSYSDVAVLARTTDQTFVAAVVVRQSASVGYIGMRPGSSTNPGYVDFHTPDGTRRGYIGWSAAAQKLAIFSENSWGWEFSGSIVPTYNGNALLHAGGSIPAANLTGSVPNASVPLSAVQQHQASLSVGSASNATFATTAGNANAVNGYAASTAASANTVGARDGNGYLRAVYFQMTGAVADPAVTELFTGTGDGYFYRSTVASAGRYIEARNISGRTGTAKNLAAGSGPPSLAGSTNGDLFYYY